MNVERHLIPESTIEDFARTHGLVMEVHERSQRRPMTPDRFYAHFQNCEIGDGRFLIGAFGDGSTEAEAIRNYAARISEQDLVIGAYTATRREIRAPRLVTAKARHARPGVDQINAALREIRAVLQACEEGQITISAALDQIHDLSNLADADTMMATLEERTESRTA